MTVFGDVLSFVSTIGRIAGALSGAINDSVAFVDLGPTGDDTSLAPTLGQAVFFNDSNGITRVFNTSTQSTLGLFFPGDADTAAQELFIPPATSFPLSPTFQTYATGSTEFIVMPTDPLNGNSNAVPNVLDPDPPGSNPNAVIGVQSSQPILPNVTTNIGGNITVQINVTERVLLVAVGGLFTLGGIVLLNVRGAGDTLLRIINIVRGSGGGLVTAAEDPQQMSVPIPEGIDISKGLTFIDIAVAVGGFQNALQVWAQNHADLIAPATEADRTRLASFAATRKRQKGH